MLCMSWVPVSTWIIGILTEIFQDFLQNIETHLTFMGPCIVTYSYSTTNKMHLFIKLFILVKRSTCFGQFFCPLSGAQNCTYSDRHMSNSCCYLLLVGMSPLASGSNTDICLFICIIPVSLHTFFPPFWKFEYSLVVEFRSSCSKTLTHSCLECLVCLVMLASHLILHKTKEMVTEGC